MDQPVTKIYELRTLGYDQVSKELGQVAGLFERIKKAKLNTQGQLIAANDVTSIKKYSDELARLTVEEQKLKTERQKLMNEQKAAQIQRQKEIEQRRQETSGVNAAAGSYRALYNEYRDLYKVLGAAPKGANVTFRGLTMGYDEATQALQRLASAEQNWRRQFTRDGLLVGEYTSGIVQAFRNMGLDDMIKGQVDRAGQSLQALNGRFDELRQELEEVKRSGQGSFDDLERELIENRKEAIALEKSIEGVKAEFKSTGNIGSQITAGISNGFKQLGGTVRGFMLQFLGIQALFNKITSEVSAGLMDARQIEGVESAFQRLNDPRLLDNLRQATRGTVNDLELMRQAVMASNFQIPLEQMATLLDFARRRAKETGQEVDYLVQSIITGIGRKSPLILDNLGISAVRLREELKGVASESADVGDVAAAVGRIIQEENRKAGAEIETTSERLAQNQAKWENVRREIGEKVLPVMAAFGSILAGIVGFIAGIPFPLMVAGLGAVTAALALYKAEQVRSYVATQIATKQGLIYNAYLIAKAGYLRITTLAMKAATTQIVLFNGAIRISPLGLLLTTLGLIVPAIAAFAARVKDAKSEMDALRQVNDRASESINRQRSVIDGWMAVIRSSKTSIDAKRDAVQQLMKIDDQFNGVMKDNIINLDLLEKAYIKVTAAIEAQARAEAAATLVAQKKQKVDELSLLQLNVEQQNILKGGKVNIQELSKIEQEIFGGIEKRLRRIDGDVEIGGIRYNYQELINTIKGLKDQAIEEFSAMKDVQAQTDAAFADLTRGKDDATFYEVNIEKLKADIEELDKQINGFKGSNADLQKLIADRKKLQDQLDKLLGSGSATGRPGRLTQSDPFKIIDAERDRLLADQEKMFISAEIKETQYLKNVLSINQEAVDKKLDIIKGSSAEELKVRAQLSLEREKLEKETNEKLRSIAENQFSEIVKDLERQRDAVIVAARQAQAEVDADPISSPGARAEAKLQADKKVLDAHRLFGEQLDALEEMIGLQSVENTIKAGNAVKDAQRDVFDSQIAAGTARLEDIRIAGEKSISAFREAIAKQRDAISESTTISSTGRSRGISALNREEEVGVLAREVASMKIQLPIYKRLLDEKKITDQEYYNFAAELAKKQGQLNDLINKDIEDAKTRVTGLSSFFQNKFRDIFNVEVGSIEDGVLAQAIADTYSFATDAMNSYYDAERQAIENSVKLQMERLDIEHQQMLARAQTAEEEISLQKQHKAEQDKINRKAFEDNKRMQLKQAEINLATQLSNLAVIAFAPGPANLLTLGAAGQVAYALQAALAIATYAMNVRRIKSQQFEFGGSPDEVPLRGGKFKGRPHSRGGTDFFYKGNKYNAEVDELSIIRTKNAPKNGTYTITGSQKQIASALNRIGGGVEFAPGAKLSRFEMGGHLGESLQPPIYTSRLQTINNFGGISRDDLQEFTGRIEDLAEEQSKRIDRLEVVQVTGTVTQAQQKEARQEALATL